MDLIGSVDIVWVTMSERELQRIQVLVQVVDGRLDIDAAAHVLAISRRQVFRLLKSFRFGPMVPLLFATRPAGVPPWAVGWKKPKLCLGTLDGVAYGDRFVGR